MAKQEEKTKVGYMWYPNDWKQSDTFFDIDDPLIRYFYREIIDILYLNSNSWEESKERFEKAQRLKISDKNWLELRSLFKVENDNLGRPIWSHSSVEKRIDGRAVSSAENGVKGGRPKGSEKPNNNLNDNLKNNLSEPKKPNSTIKEKENINKPNPNKGYGLYVIDGGSRIPVSRPLWGAGPGDNPDAMSKLISSYGNSLAEALSSGSIEPGNIAAVFWLCCPVKIEKGGPVAQGLTKYCQDSDRGYETLHSLVSNMTLWSGQLRHGHKLPEFRVRISKWLEESFVPS